MTECSKTSKVSKVTSALSAVAAMRMCSTDIQLQGAVLTKHSISHAHLPKVMLPRGSSQPLTEQGRLIPRIHWTLPMGNFPEALTNLPWISWLPGIPRPPACLFRLLHSRSDLHCSVIALPASSSFLPFSLTGIALVKHSCVFNPIFVSAPQRSQANILTLTFT